ncbi:MAG: 16S rRNA (cytidine(1402)-2'-O)-methyltransferase [Bryobacterales bacterium]|nr:16S rRNA (cytidine(1402)-2'-O)-methyltransferase [Bryobacterales bacterium]
MAASLFIVATPIGNLEDLTFRAVRVLGEVAVVACEDTRHTRVLLDHYGISSLLVSYHEHNEAKRTQELLGRLEAGQSVALVSDAGTPLISDPGYRLVSAAVEAGITVVPVPGVSAAVTALSASGLPTDAFCFAGFFPSKQTQRLRLLKQHEGAAATLIFYEAPHRILETLDDIERVLGDRRVVIARELSKIHEEFLRGTPGELRTILAARDVIRGEMTVLIAKAEHPPVNTTPVAEAVGELMGQGMGRMEAIKAVARSRGMSKRDVYRAVEES